MTDLNVTFNTVSLPTGTSGTLTVYEDDSGGSVADRSDTVSLSDGVTEYTLTGFDGSSGNTVWPEVDLDNTDVTATGSTVELLSVEVVVTTVTAAVSGAVTTSAQTPNAGATGSGTATASPDGEVTVTAQTPNAGGTGTGSISVPVSGEVNAAAQTPDAGGTGSGSVSVPVSGEVTVTAQTPDAGAAATGAATVSPSGAVTVSAQTLDVAALLVVYATTELPDEDQPVLDSSVEDEISLDRETEVSDYGDVRIQIRETGETSWDSNATGYAEHVLDHATLTDTFLTLEDGEEYEIRARTETEHVTGEWTTPTSAITVLPAPSAHTLTVVGQNQIDSAWTENADNEDGLRVYVAEELDPRANTGFGSFSEDADLAPDSAAYSLTNLQPNHDYKVYIQAYTEHTTADSSTVTATTDIDTTLSQSLVLSSASDTIQLKPDEIVAKNLDKITTGIGDARVEVPEEDAIIPYVQRQDRVDYYVDGNSVFTGYGVGFSGNERTGRWTLRLDGIGKRLEETRPDYASLGGNVTYTSTALDEAIRDYWGRTPFSATVTDQTTELVAQNEQLQSADTTTEWGNVTTIGANEPLVIQNGNLELAQTSFTREGEAPDSGTDSGQAGIQGYHSGGSAATFDGTGDISFNFTPDYDILGGDFGFYVRINTEPGSDGTEVIFEVNGTEVDRFPQGGGVGDPGTWRDVANNPFSGGGYSSGDLSGGTQHTVRIRSGAAGGDLTTIDVIAPQDTRFSYFFDNDNGGNDGYLDGPELYPSSYAVELTENQTAYNIPEADVTTTWNDTSGTQAIAVSNDGGATYTSAANSSTLTANFAGAGRTAQTKFTFSRYGSRTTATPQTGYLGQVVQDYTLQVDLNDLVVIDKLELSRDHFSNLKSLHDYGDFLWVIEHGSAAIGNLTVSSFPRGAETRTAPAAFSDVENIMPEVAAENYFNSVYLEGALQDDGTRPTATVKDSTAITADGREITPGVLRDQSVSTEAGAQFRANALLTAALNNNELRGSISTYPAYVQPGYSYSVDFGEGAKNKTLERVSITESTGTVSASYEFVVKEELAETISNLKREGRTVGNQV